MRPLVEWNNGRTMNRYINVELDKRYEAWKNDKLTASARAKSVMDIAIEAYMEERSASEKLDSGFKAWATAQIRLFLFAGHDSTAATIVYSLYMLSKHPDTLSKIRAELDEVFGETPAAQKLKQFPNMFNQLPYTTAVIKETLRLFPPASGMRGGLPDVFLRDKNGNKFPTEGLNIWIVHGAIQRNPNYWPDPHSFLPDRWLVEPGHPLYPPKGGWRPFEYGPRNCVGQTLAMLDIKITLAMVVREFDVQDQYQEWDQLHPSPSSEIKTVFGERAYQVPQGAAHPVHGFPCKISLRKEHTV